MKTAYLVVSMNRKSYSDIHRIDRAFGSRKEANAHMEAKNKNATYLEYFVVATPFGPKLAKESA